MRPKKCHDLSDSYHPLRDKWTKSSIPIPLYHHSVNITNVDKKRENSALPNSY